MQLRVRVLNLNHLNGGRTLILWMPRHYGGLHYSPHPAWSIDRSIDRLIWLIDWSIERLIDRLSGRLGDWSIYWSSIDWLIPGWHYPRPGWSIERLLALLIDWSIYRLIGRLFDLLINRLSDRLIAWLIGWFIDWLITWMIAWSVDSLIYRLIV